MDEEIYFDSEQEDLLQLAVDFARDHGNGAIKPVRGGLPVNRNVPDQPVGTFLLLQNLYGGRQALAIRTTRQWSTTRFWLQVVGINPVLGSSFYLIAKLNGIELLNVELSVTMTAAEMFAAITAAWTTLNAENFGVYIGNPFNSFLLNAGVDITEPEDPEPGQDPLPRKSWPGIWILDINPMLFAQDAVLTMEVAEDNTVFMQGLSEIQVFPCQEMLVNEMVYVEDPYNLAELNPLKAGVRVTGLYDPPRSAHIPIASTHRDITVDVDVVGGYTDPTP